MTKYAGGLAVLKRNTTGSTYVTVVQVLDMGDVGYNRAQIDVTAYGDSWTDTLAGLKEGTEFTLTVAYDPNDTQHQALKADFDAGTTKKYQLSHPGISPTTNAGWEFTVVPLNFVASAPQDGAWQAVLTFKIVNPGVVAVT